MLTPIHQCPASDLVRTYAMKTAEGRLACRLCEHVTHKTYNMRSHLEGKHQLGGYQCDICYDSVSSTKQALYKHKLSCPKLPQQQQSQYQ